MVDAVMPIVMHTALQTWQLQLVCISKTENYNQCANPVKISLKSQQRKTGFHVEGMLGAHIILCLNHENKTEVWPTQTKTTCAAKVSATGVKQNNHRFVSSPEKCISLLAAEVILVSRQHMTTSSAHTIHRFDPVSCSEFPPKRFTVSLSCTGKLSALGQINQRLRAPGLI